MLGREGSISAAEWRWLAIATTLILVFLTAPYVVAYLLPPQGYVFQGSLWDTADLSPYLAAIREGAATDSWLVHNHLTPEAHQPALIYFSYVLVGKMAGGWLGTLPIYWLYLTLSRAGLLVAVYAFVSAFLERIRWRRTAFLLIVFSSGLGSLFLLLSVRFQNPALYQTFNVDLKLKEFNTFLVFFTHPHFSLSLGLLLLTARSWLLYLREPRWRDLVVALSCLFALGLVNPYTTVVVDAALMSTLIGRTLAQGRFDRSASLALLAVLLVTLPLLIYNFLTFVQDPFWGKIYSEQSAHTHISPTPPALLAGYGLVLALAVLGGVTRFPERSPKDQFAFLWIGTSIILAYVPFSFQNRALFGVHPFLGVMAVHGLDYLSRLAAAVRARLSGPGALSQHLGRIVHIGARDLLVALLIGAVVGIYVIVLSLALDLTGLGVETGAYERVTLVEAARWLEQHSGPNDVVMAAYRSGNLLAAYASGQVFFGHYNATLEPEEKNRLVMAFYDPSTEDGWRRDLVARYGITHVMYGPYEAALGDFGAAKAPYLELAYRAEDLSLYRVNLNQK